jgi:6-pyruvoyltetrahydropterin/6-carboxytetrahydropterin synthase
MLIDFSDLKAWLTGLVHDEYDHAFVVDKSDTVMRHALTADPYWNVVVVPFTPTAENWARHIFDTLAPIVEKHWRGNLTLTKIEFWETPTSVAVVEA